jgi:hypothetical protein
VIDVHSEENHGVEEVKLASPSKPGNTVCQILLSAVTSSGFNQAMPDAAPVKKRENILLNLVFNIAIPSLILSKMSSEQRLGPAVALIVALAFPLGYGIWDFAQRRQTNFISLIGFFSVLLTGGLGLMKVAGIWFAVKEAAVPLVIGVCVLLSMKTRRPLVKTLLYNEQVIDVARVSTELNRRGNGGEFEALLRRASLGLAGSFLVSAALNFGLARYLLKSPPGTEAFNAELAKMNYLSWPVIAIPSTAVMMFVLWRLIKGIEKLTGLKLEEIFNSDKK